MRRNEKKKIHRISGHPGKAYPVSLRTAAVRDYLSGMTRLAVAQKYSLPDLTIISHWKRKFGACEIINASTQMVKRRRTRLPVTDSESIQSARIKELERSLCECRKALLEKDRQLKDKDLRLLISDTMIDLAEEHFNVDIRKNFDSK